MARSKDTEEKDIKKENKRRRRSLKTPIALHFYAAFTVIILFFFIGFLFLFNSDSDSYIKEQSTKRIRNVRNSFSELSKSFVATVDTAQYKTSKEVRNALFNLISTSNTISNDASVAVFYEDAPSNRDEIKLKLIWPNETYSPAATENTRNLISRAIESQGFTKKETKLIEIDGKKYFYYIDEFKYSANKLYSENYYMFIYVDATNYYTYAYEQSQSLLSTMLITIIIAGIMSIIIPIPIILSTRKLSRFASRISTGDFSPYNGFIASRELMDLSEKMNQMAQRLDESDKEQKTFFQNASHELRTPLMSIQGYAEGMKYGVFDDENREEAIDIIISETSRLSNMVENLLSISKMDLAASKGYTVKKSIVNVYELLGVTIEKIRGNFLLSEKELVNNIKIASNVHILANENDIFRMLENIFSNCIRYAKKNVYFTCYTEDRFVVLEISDDGPGISDEVLSHLFDRFAKGSDGKHGIGMALVKAIAMEHNATVEASNKDEGGARFVIRIPTINANEQLSQTNKKDA